MTAWRQDLGRCFGLVDRRFAGHPSDLQTAYEMLGKLIKENISMAEVEAEVRNLLRNNPNLHADEQVVRIRNFLQIWLDG